MKPTRIGVALLLAIAARPAFAQDFVAAAKQTPVASLDSTLPQVPLAQWLVQLRGNPATPVGWEVNDCGEGGDGNVAPTCVEASVPLGRDTALASLVVAGTDGTPASQLIVWYLTVGSGDSYTSFKTLHEWAASVRAHRP